MKIAVLTNSISRANGGVSEVARRLSQELARQGAGTIEVLGLRDAFFDADAPAWAPLHPRAYEPRAPRSYGRAPEMLAELREFQPELAHVHGIWSYPTLAARQWSGRAARPYLVSIHGMLDPWALAHSRWKKRLAAILFERENLRRAECLHAIAPAEAEAIRNYGLRNPICVIPNAVDLPPETDAGPAPWPEAVRGRKVLLYLGRIHPKKGLSVLLAGWQEARAHLAEWTLVIAGWDQGGHEAELRAAARRAGLADDVHFVGPQFGPAKTAAYRHASAFILPSFSEGLPLVVLEAWAHRLPVLMTPACNLPRGFEAGAALSIDSTPQGIAPGLARLAALTDEERQTMGARGRVLVEREFTWPAAAAQMRRVYKWLAGVGARPEIVD